MPICCDVSIHQKSQQEFGQIAYDVMRHAFAVHNRIGRFFDETVYQNELANRLAERALKEVAIRTRHRGFEEIYRIDLLVDRGGLFELKCVSEMHEAHRSQLMHYLMLTGLKHGKLVNFRNDTVEHEFVNCEISETTRKSFRVKVDCWNDRALNARMFRETLLGILQDWGAGLSLELYNEAMVELLREYTGDVANSALLSNRSVVVRPRLNLAAPDTAFKLTGLTKGFANFESHLRRYMSHAGLDSLYWVNINLDIVQFVTLSESKQQPFFCP